MTCTDVLVTTPPVVTRNGGAHSTSENATGLGPVAPAATDFLVVHGGSLFGQMVTR